MVLKCLFSLFSWNWDHVKTNLVISLFILASGLAKLVFHKAHWLSSRVPESCLLILLGVLFGGLLYGTSSDYGDNAEPDVGNTTISMFKDIVLPDFTADMFFLYLLPPIILEASWSLYNTNFFNNLRAILLLAVLGTVANFLLIGSLLVAVVSTNLITTEITVSQTFLFASLISAVDPVAVLSIFTEVGVNPHLYFLVFGESLLNDGVAVVLYKTMTVFVNKEHEDLAVTVGDVCLASASFLTIALGGLSVGIVWGLLTALVTRFTPGVRIIEPLALFCGGYLAYITAELFHWSGIISLIGCGLVQAHYAFRNISAESRTTANYFIKMLSSTSDCIIFLYLGIAWFNNQHVWDTGFVLFSVVFTLIVRFVVTYNLALLINWLRGNIHPITLREMFVMAFGGLRGAVAFSLVITINKEQVGRDTFDMLVTTTLVIIMQTVFLQGGTIKWIVNKLKIEKDEDTGSCLMVETNNKLFDHIMLGVETISGKCGQYYYQDVFARLDEKYLQKIFCSADAEHDMLSLLSSVGSLNDHFLNLYGPSLVTAQELNSSSGYVNPLCSPEKAGQDKVIEISSEESKLQYRSSLKKALSYDPVVKLNAVVDRSLVRVEEHDLGHHLHRRRQSAHRMRRRIFSDEKNTAERVIDPRRTSSVRGWRPRSEESEETADEVDTIKRIHQEFRRRKTMSRRNKSIINEEENQETTGL